MELVKRRPMTVGAADMPPTARRAIRDTAGPVEARRRSRCPGELSTCRMELVAISAELRGFNLHGRQIGYERVLLWFFG
ncbi:MAG: hypothetical protein LBQ30_11125 [Treponema sp.]|nr:hypothetical protein [Treponema sp.]